MANESFARLTGYAPEALLAHTVPELRLFEDVERDGALLDRLRRRDALPQVDVSVRTSSGETRLAIMAGKPIDFDDRACLLVTLLDTTERTRTEEELRRAISAVVQDGTWLADRVLERLA